MKGVTEDHALTCAIRLADGLTDVREISLALLRGLDPRVYLALCSWAHKRMEYIEAVRTPITGAPVVSSPLGVLWLKAPGMSALHARILAAMLPRIWRES